MNHTVMDWSEGLDTQSFSGLALLKAASAQGARAADILGRHQVLESLAAYDPEVVGTLPLAIGTPESDIDILCRVSDLAAFDAFADERFGGFDGYSRHLRNATRHVAEALVVCFDCEGLPIEIFATNGPTRTQYGFIHMLVEARILSVMGDAFANDVRALKQSGLKTEPVFAKLLGLAGDPYIALAELAELSPSELCERLDVPRN
ncbi:DUF4269 domain-containing protein [Thalassospira sp. HJ]|uniref:DUF4269 domain-containing protein n=1 Tax=Thalassospira sp. HJ TaxID=1616823 RepID=UPI001F1C3FD0|nr:DUF4269 domain-containing protein [Thalassospira sp. HJ]